MANVIELGPSNSQRIVADYIDQFSRDQENRRRDELLKQQMAQQGAFQQGQLGMEQQRIQALHDQLTQANDFESAKNALAALQPLMNEGRSDDVQKIVQDAIAQNPRLKPLLIGAAQYHASAGQQAQGVANQTTLNTAQTIRDKGPAPSPEQFETYGQTLWGHAPSAPSFQDVQSQQPEMAATKGTPESPRTQFLRQATGIEADAGQRLQSQTTKDVAGMKITAEAPLVAAEAERARAQAKAASGEMADAFQADKQELADNPDAFFSWSGKKKEAYLKAGGRAPAKIGETEKRRETQAHIGIQILDDVSALVDKWKQRGIPITGPMLGRYNEASRRWGDIPIPTQVSPRDLPEYEGDIAKIQEWLGANKVGETVAIVGGRANYQYLKELAPPAISQNPSFIGGAISGMKQRYQETIDQYQKIRWGPKGPPAQPASSTSGDQGVITTPDGLKWRKNPDGSMTQVQ